MIAAGNVQLLFRYWTNGEVMLQACALGYNLDSEKVQCVEQHVKATSVDESTLAIFEFTPIPEPFTVGCCCALLLEVLTSAEHCPGVEKRKQEQLLDHRRNRIVQLVA